MKKTGDTKQQAGEDRQRAAICHGGELAITLKEQKVAHDLDGNLESIALVVRFNAHELVGALLIPLQEAIRAGRLWLPSSLEDRSASA